MCLVKPTLIVMVKEPRPGRVKTRLGRDIGLVPAAWWFRHQTRTLLRRLKSPRWSLVLAVSPDVEGQMSRVWPADLTRWPQGQGDLGERMGRLMRRAGGRVCVIGADIPGIRQRHIAKAFKTLDANDVVFEPSFDGGYWLVGLKRARPLPAGMFADVRWSTSNALTDSVASLPGKRIAFVDQLNDVDEVQDLP